MNSNNRLGQKGQVYLLVLIILSGLFASVVFLSSEIEVYSMEKPQRFLLDNLKYELFHAYEFGLYLNDVNQTVSEMIFLFNEKAVSENQKMKLCLTAFDGNQNYVFVNFLQQDSNYFSAKLDVDDNFFAKNSSKIISKQSLLNDYNLTLCNQLFNLRKDLQVYIALEREGDVLVWSNLG